MCETFTRNGVFIRRHTPLPLEEYKVFHSWDRLCFEKGKSAENKKRLNRNGKVLPFLDSLPIVLIPFYFLILKISWRRHTQAQIWGRSTGRNAEKSQMPP